MSNAFDTYLDICTHSTYVYGQRPYVYTGNAEYVECIHMLRHMSSVYICTTYVYIPHRYTGTPVYIVDIYRMCIYVETYVYVERYVKRIHMSSVCICQNICRMYTYGVLCMLIRIMYVNTYCVC